MPDRGDSLGMVSRASQKTNWSKASESHFTLTTLLIYVFPQDEPLIYLSKNAAVFTAQHPQSPPPPKGAFSLLAVAGSSPETTSLFIFAGRLQRMRDVRLNETASDILAGSIIQSSMQTSSYYIPNNWLHQQASLNLTAAGRESCKGK